MKGLAFTLLGAACFVAALATNGLLGQLMPEISLRVGIQRDKASHL
jgi:hypothetical protein